MFSHIYAERCNDAGKPLKPRATYAIIPSRISIARLEALLEDLEAQDIYSYVENSTIQGVSCLLKEVSITSQSQFPASHPFDYANIFHHHNFVAYV